MIIFQCFSSKGHDKLGDSGMTIFPSLDLIVIIFLCFSCKGHNKLGDSVLGSFLVIFLRPELDCQRPRDACSVLSETGMAQSDNIGDLTNTFDICQFQIKLKCQEDKCSFTFYLHSSVCIMRSLSDHKTYLERCGEIKLE